MLYNIYYRKGGHNQMAVLFSLSKNFTRSGSRIMAGNQQLKLGFVNFS